MLLTSSAANLTGAVRIPASKSHTVRALIFATLAQGESIIRHPLESGDTRSALLAAAGLGATVSEEGDLWRVQGRAGQPLAKGQTINVGNSGTTLFLALSTAALAREGEIIFDGDAQIRKRTANNLLVSLTDLGAKITASKDGCCPLRVSGGLRGGRTSLECPTSQYLSSLLMSLPFAESDSVIEVPLLYEKPYVYLTLKWLDDLGLRYEKAADLSRFEILGGQHIDGFDTTVAADFSSATFFLCAAAITGSELLVAGLDMNDPQGDKAVVDYLRAMGATITAEAAGLRVQAGTELVAADLDLNATPDALPAMAVTAACARGTSVLGNVPNARLKETDRITVMASELSKLGITVRERPDGLEIEGGKITGGEVCGHDDHRIVMAFAIAGLAARGTVTVDSAEAAAVTFPTFGELLQAVGGKVSISED